MSRRSRPAADVTRPVGTSRAVGHNQVPGSDVPRGQRQSWGWPTQAHRKPRADFHACTSVRGQRRGFRLGTLSWGPKMRVHARYLEPWMLQTHTAQPTLALIESTESVRLMRLASFSADFDILELPSCKKTAQQQQSYTNANRSSCQHSPTAAAINSRHQLSLATPSASCLGARATTVSSVTAASTPVVCRPLSKSNDTSQHT